MRGRIYKKRKELFILKSVVLPLATIAALLSAFVIGVNMLEKDAEQERMSALLNAVTRASVQCYALEGQYPPNVDYLTENYGIIYDADKYVIHYRGFASNMMPEIRVFSTEDVDPEDMYGDEMDDMADEFPDVPEALELEEVAETEE